MSEAGQRDAPAEPRAAASFGQASDRDSGGSALLRVATYNVHGCVGKGGLRPERVAEVVASLDCDIVALQEIDVRRPRSGTVDQLTFLARRLGYDAVFGAAWHRDEQGAYGNAVLSRLPILHSHTLPLPTTMGLRCEPRSLVEARIATPLGEVVVWSTHLGVRAYERTAQLGVIIERLKEAQQGASRAPIVLLGDLNVGPGAQLIRSLTGYLADARRTVRARAPTYPSWLPVLALDHVLVSSPLQVVSLQAERSQLRAAASDHLPLTATLRWDEGKRATVAG